MPVSQDMFKAWNEFYLLVGTAAATLIGLLFVAASIGVGFLTAERASASRVYMTPVIFHFSSILFVSLVVLVPSHPQAEQILLISASAVVGAACSSLVFIRVLTHSVADWMDRLAYGAAPVLSYLGCLVASIQIFRGSSRGLDLLAGALVLLLLANIRNAWDLTLVMVRFRSRSGE